jgi:hypothetical protein
VRQKQIAASIQPVHDGLIRRISTFVSKANQVQWRRCRKFKSRVITHPLGDLPNKDAIVMLERAEGALYVYNA